MDWKIEYYSDKRGNEPVRNFIDAQSLDAQVEILHVIVDLLQEFALDYVTLTWRKLAKRVLGN